MQISESELLTVAVSFIWPLFRIGAMFVSFPIFSSRSVPIRIRVILSIAITLLVMPLLPPLTPIPVFSYQSLMVGVQQVLIGLMTGFGLQLVFAAVVFGGQSIAFSMGLGFASMVDPQTGVQVPIIAQLYLMLATLVFLGMDAHLLFIELMLNSFHTLPISVEGITPIKLWQLTQWGSHIFVGGFLLAIPILSTLLLVNLGFGVATRAAPQLNIFSVGFSVTILLGLLLIWVTLPTVLYWFSGFSTEAYHLINNMLAG